MSYVLFIIATIIAWKVLGLIICTLNPEYALKKAMARHQNHPTEANLQAVFRAQDRLTNHMNRSYRSK